MAVAFVVLFPLGALTIRVLRSRSVVYIHAGSQLLAYTVALAGFGIGVWVAHTTHQVRSRRLSPGHPLRPPC